MLHLLGWNYVVVRLDLLKKSGLPPAAAALRFHHHYQSQLLHQPSVTSAGISPAAMAASQYYSQFYQNCFNNSAAKPTTTTAPNIIAGPTTPTSLFSPGKNSTHSFHVRRFYAISLLLIIYMFD